MIKQKDEHSCGQAAALNILILLYKTNQAGLWPLKEACFSFAEIKASLLDYGVEAEGYQAESFAQVRMKKKKAVLLLEEGEKKHFVVLVWKICGLARVFDPETGYEIVSKRSLGRSWRGKILLCGLKEKKPFRTIDVIRCQEQAAFWAFGLLEGIMMGWALAGLMGLWWAFMALAGLIGYYLTLWLEKSYALKVSCRLDKEVIVSYLQGGKEAEDIQKASQFKAAFIKGALERPNMFVSLALALSLAAFSPPVYLCLFLASIGSRLLLLTVFGPLERKAQALASQEEKMALGGLNVDSALFASASKEGADFGRLELLEVMLGTFLTAVFATVACFLLQEADPYKIAGYFLFAELLTEETLKPFKEGGLSFQEGTAFLRLDKRIYQCPQIYRRRRRN
jgi:hypothetical protein